MFRKDVFPWLWVMQDWKAQHMKSILLLRTKCETCDFYENSPNMRDKDMFIPFSHMCKQWGMKAFTSLPEYVAHFTFPLCVSWAYKSSRNLYFYPWALSTAKLIRHCWPPGGAQTQPAASASCLRARQDSSKEGISIGAVQGQPPLDAVSAAIWPRNAQNKTTPGKGKTSQTRGQVGQCAMGRCWEVRECDYPLCCEWLCLYRESWPQT